jgi:hypothetical protein
MGIHLDNAKEGNWDEDVDLAAQIARHSNVQILHVHNNLIGRIWIDGDS